MARPGPKSRFTPDVLAQMKRMHETGVSQADIARAFQTSQQTVSRELARYTAVKDAPAEADYRDPIAYVNGFDSGIYALQAIRDVYLTTGDMEWRTASLAAWRVKFRKQP